MNDAIGAVKKLLTFIALSAVSLVNSRRRIIKAPTKWLEVPLKRTTRRVYKTERGIYKLTDALIRRGDLIEARDYHIYKQIAQKYDWPFIKESYDQD